MVKYDMVRSIIIRTSSLVLHVNHMYIHGYASVNIVTIMQAMSAEN